MNTKSFNRKTWLGAMFTFALVAVLGLTFAFVPAKSVVEKKVQPSLYWYSISSSSTLQAQLNTSPQTKDDSMQGGANPITDCADETETNCIVGYPNPQTINSLAPAPASDDHRIAFSKQTR
ncbi:hypothetical protein [Pedobacter antarcticus]|uniref:hypothetical protein n=1 Tax=Pedobacter antarcticus TaxID=34086 RepID=UPI000885C2D1|nr:hypothetical protein [Pedobacter antarcticus]SDL38468.1 hypothetical protein SAMN04488084_101120 [Pedobacter antarcticus]